MKPLSILLFLALAIPAFADSVIDLGEETHTSFYITINPNGSSSLTVIGTGGSATDQFTFDLWDASSNRHGTDWFGQGTLDITGKINLSGNLTDITWNLTTDVVTANFDGMRFVSPLTHQASQPSYLTTVPEPGTLALLGTGLCGIAGMVRRELGRRKPRGVFIDH
jgi:hypothetical protein